MLLPLLTALCPVGPQASGEVDPATVQRLASLARLWAKVEHVHPDVGSVDWDGALLEVLPQVRRGEGPAAFEDAVATLLSSLGDPATRIVGPPPSPGEWADMTEAIYRPPAEVPDEPEPRATPLGEGAWLLVARDLGEVTASSKRARGHALREALGPASGAQVFVLDLRTGELPYSDDVLELALRQFRNDLRDALPLLLDRPLYLPAEARRISFGMPPQGGGYSSGGFSRGLYVTEHPAIGPEATRAPHLVLVVDPHNPDATELATSLRAGGRARVVLVGDPAERRELASVRHVELEGGLRVAIRDRHRVFAGGALFEADVVLPADAEDEVVHEAALALARSPRAEPPTPAAAAGRATVPLGRAADRAAWRELGPDVRLLSLFRLWATFDRYYPYKHLLDEPWDDVLVDLIPVFLAAEGREGYQDAVRLSLARTRDGHTRLAGAGPLGGPATVPLPLAVVEGKVVVVAAPDLAVEADIRPGDVVVAVDGRSARERFDALAPFASSSTRPGLELVVARHLLAGPVGSRVTVTLRRAEREWDVTLDRAEDAWPATRHPIGRTDLPVYTELTERIGYADLDRLTNAEVDTMLARFRELPAIVLDMRGYPNYTMPLLADRLADGPVVAAQMRLPVPYDDQHDYSLAFEHVFGSARPSSYDGRIVVLVNVEAISQAEHTCLVLERAAPDVTFIGTPTRGANGDVTVFEIPGGLSVTFTGWGVRHADGAQLQRRGIQPDIVVAPTIVGLREGRDEVLEAALAFLEQSPPSGAPVDR